MHNKKRSRERKNEKQIYYSIMKYVYINNWKYNKGKGE